MLRDSYALANGATLQRLCAELVPQFEVAFRTVEADMREWMPNAANEQQHVAEFADHCVAAFDAGTVFAYAMVGQARDVVGYISIRPEADHALVGYWVRPDCRGRGLAPDAVSALTDAAFASMPSVTQVRAHLDAANAASRRVLEKAGFVLRETFTRPPRTDSESDTEWLYARERADGG